MQYCIILEVAKVSDATAVGILLQRHGYKIVSTQVTPLSCPVSQEGKNCESCGQQSQPAALISGNFKQQ